MIKQRTLRQGYLVVLNTTVTGKNVRYNKRELEKAHIDADGAERAKWEQTRTILDKAEAEAAKTARGACRNAIIEPCSWCEFGYMVPDEKLGELQAAERKAQTIADDFNRTAKLTSVNIFVLTGRIEADDETAMRKINGELRNALDDAQAAAKALDPAAIREAVGRVKQMSAMLSDDVRESTLAAIKAGNEIATGIGRQARQEAEKRLQKTGLSIGERATAVKKISDELLEQARAAVASGEAAAISIDQTKFDAISNARTAFLDTDSVAVIGEVEIESRAELEPVAWTPEPIDDDENNTITINVDDDSSPRLKVSNNTITRDLFNL